ncbi:MAG: Mrp/NBP35 family ATP-binding protein [bacterium]
MVSPEAVKEKLRAISYPDTDLDLVSSGAIKDVQVEDSTAKIVLSLDTRDLQIRKQITNEIRREVEALEGIKQVAMEISGPPPQPKPKPSHVPSDKTAPKLLTDIRHKIAVASGKGGVGKSTVATNLALALSKLGARVGLLDADIYGPNIPIMMGINKRPMAQGNQIVPLERFGIKIMSIGFFLEENSPVVWRGPMVGKAIEQFMRDVIWEDVDYFICDMPPGTGDAQLSLSSLIDLEGSIIVTTPQAVALADVVRGVEMFRKVDVNILGVVENMSYFVCPHCQERTEIFDHGGGKRTSEKLGVPFLGAIPINPDIRIGGDSGEPIMVSKPESPESQAFLEIARKMLGELPLPENVGAG